MAEEQPAWLSPKARKQAQNRRSGASERNLARERGGRVQAGSGSSWRAPQDIKTDDHLIQHKYTDKRRFSLDATELQRLLDDALRAGRGNEFIIDFEQYGIRALVTVERRARQV